MAKKNDFDFGNYFDQGALDQLFDKSSKIAPTKNEVEIVNSTVGDVIEIDIKNLKNYHNHTYKVLDNEDMEALKESISDYGIILPLLVRKKGVDSYEIVSGHRRKHAAKKLGLQTVPCKIIDVDDDMADIIMADTNLAREIILPSEKAKTYKVRLEAAVRQGKKPADELDVMADESPDSLSKIKRYLRVATLSPTLLDMVDNGDIPLMAGVTISALSKEHQKVVEEVLVDLEKGLSLKDAEKIKTASKRGLTKETVISILEGDLKPRESKPKSESRKSVTEKMLEDAIPEDVLSLPLEDRVILYREALTTFFSKNS